MATVSNKKNSKVDLKKRNNLNSMGKALAAFAALTLFPNISHSKDLIFKRKTANTGDLRVQGGDLIGDGANDIKGFSKVYNAVWNDMAEFRPLKQGTENTPGKCYVMTEQGLMLSNKTAQLGTVGVCSDSFGYTLGGDGSDASKVAIGISGWVLAYVDKKYPIGTALTSGPKGILTKAGLCTKLTSSERIVGIVETSPKSYNNLKIDGRYWVKIS